MQFCSCFLRGLHISTLLMLTQGDFLQWQQPPMECGDTGIKSIKDHVCDWKKDVKINMFPQSKTAHTRERVILQR